ncbi:MAG TPA: hypothetical protein VFQ34_07510 [Nitrospiraceae bacterium]|nr:hypothetical protein [Nitrospiraceae bacterium]
MKTRLYSLIAAAAGSCCFYVLAMATASSAIAVEMEAQGRHSLLKRPSIEAAIARAKEKTPAAVAGDTVNRPHSLVVPLERLKGPTGIALLRPDGPLPATSLASESVSSRTLAVPISASTVTLD